MIMIMDRNQLVGAKGVMPWHLPSDLSYFKSITMGKPVIMGRKTHESIGAALPGRTNIVITREPGYTAQGEGVVVADSLDAALTLARAHLDASDEAMVIGGAEICRLAMPLTERLYLTLIDAEFEGDTWLDTYVPEEWVETSRDERTADGYLLTNLVLERPREASRSASVTAVQ